MNTRLPSSAGIYGLCAAFLFGAAVHIVEYVLHLVFSWQQSRYSAPLYVWAIWMSALLSSIPVTWVGIRLLYMRAQCIMHGLICGWIILILNSTYWIVWFYDLTHGTRTLPGYFLSFLADAAISTIISGVVVWLLHELRSREHHDDQPLIGGVQAV